MSDVVSGRSVGTVNQSAGNHGPLSKIAVGNLTRLAAWVHDREFES
jgi:hypothetical protein